MKPHPSDAARRALAVAVYETAFAAFESFREQNVGADLAYLMAAILAPGSDFVDWTRDAMDTVPPLLGALRAKFPEDSQLWQFIRLDTLTAEDIEAMQNAAKFGIDPDNGRSLPDADNPEIAR
jgi:hypothetical protein